MTTTQARKQSYEAHARLVDAIDNLARTPKDGNNLFAEARIETIVVVTSALGQIAEAREAMDLS
jgi:hypothetical protein